MENNIQSAKSFLQQKSREIYQSRGHKPCYFIHSYGCQQSVSDGERLMQMLEDVGFEPTDDYTKSDIILLNTCCVRENAEDKVYARLGDLKALKRQNPELIIGICGCMAQEEQVVEKIKKSYRNTDIIFGTTAYKELYSMLEQVYLNRKLVVNQFQDHKDLGDGYSQKRTSKFKAFVSVMYGCNNFCSYCIVPYVRGRERSREPQSVIDEVKDLVSKGYKEITLLGQNVNSYSYGFPQLLRKINEIDGDFRIRFMSSHPKDATKELIDAIVECDKVCKQLHLPVQAGSNRILKEMNRHYTVEDYMKIVDYARSRIENFSLSTDILVGFPGETYEEFLQTKQLTQRVKYDNIYSFVYSPRKGTKAAELPDPISTKEKGLWLRELLVAGQGINQKNMQRFVGKISRVLVETFKDGRLSGKNDENIIVEFQCTENLVGEFVNVEITEAKNWALMGILN